VKRFPTCEVDMNLDSIEELQLLSASSDFSVIKASDEDFDDYGDEDFYEDEDELDDYEDEYEDEDEFEDEEEEEEFEDEL
jgi:6,7-dimethyl-8-ribityllumazine synthase